MKMKKFDQGFLIGFPKFDLTKLATEDTPEPGISTAELGKERRIFEDAEIRFARLLEDRGLEQVTELENGFSYPSVNE
jgi:hypothetical protein